MKMGPETLARMLLSAMLGCIFGYVGLITVLTVFGGGASLPVDIVDPIYGGGPGLSLAWFLASGLCALLFYQTLTEDKKEV